MNINDIMTPISLQAEMTAADKQQLQELEAVIKKGLNTYMEVGSALAQIRGQRLYREKHSTFEEYCREVWGFSKTHINRQISAVRVADVLAPIGVKIEHESVARPLVGLEDDQIVSTMAEAKKLAGDKPVTAKIVAKAGAPYRVQISSRSSAKPEKVITVEAGKSIQQLDFRPAMELLARIETAAVEAKPDQLQKELAALRKCLEALAKAAGKGAKL
jgi:hypothetical protein